MPTKTKASPKKKPTSMKGATAAPKKVAKKPASTKAPAKKKPVTATSVLDPTREWSLEEVEKYLPAAPEEEQIALRESLKRALGDAELCAIGADYRTEDIIAAVPPFTIGTLLALKTLVVLPPGLPQAALPLLVRETHELNRMNTSYEAEQRYSSTALSGRRAKLKLANGDALHARRTVANTLLRYVVPRDSSMRAELERASAGAKTWAGTEATVNAVARVLEELLKDRALAPVLKIWGYSQATVDDLRARAANVHRLASQGAALKPPQVTAQQPLDRQDGLVLTIMRVIWDALRTAKQQGKPIDTPPIGSLDRFFNPPSTNTASEDDATDDATDSATNEATNDEATGADPQVASPDATS